MTPEAVIKIAVPKSGCLAINKPGTIIINAATTKFLNFGGNDLFGESDDTFREMRDARFAEVTAQSGQLGFAAAIEHQLARFLPEGDD